MNETVFNRASKSGGGFTQIMNSFIFDKRLSDSAKIFFAAILSNKDGWILNTTEINKRLGKCYRTSARSIQELKKYGYLSMERKFGKVKWIVNEMPNSCQIGNNNDAISDTCQDGMNARTPNKSHLCHLNNCTNRGPNKTNNNNTPTVPTILESTTPALETFKKNLPGMSYEETTLKEEDFSIDSNYFLKEEY